MSLFLRMPADWATLLKPPGSVDFLLAPDQKESCSLSIQYNPTWTGTGRTILAEYRGSARIFMGESEQRHEIVGMMQISPEFPRPPSYPFLMCSTGIENPRRRSLLRRTVLITAGDTRFVAIMLRAKCHSTRTSQICECFGM